jgi:hypothetical protein
MHKEYPVYKNLIFVRQSKPPVASICRTHARKSDSRPCPDRGNPTIKSIKYAIIIQFGQYPGFVKELSKGNSDVHDLLLKKFIYNFIMINNVESVTE